MWRPPTPRVARRWLSRSPAQYHDSTDFCWEALRARVSLPSFVATRPSASTDGADQEARWELAYRTHRSTQAQLFKERRYLLNAFPLLREAEAVLEVGCGNGSSVLPILRGNTTVHVHATDPSATAIDLTRAACEEVGVARRLTTGVQDEDSLLGGALHGTFDVACVVFTASAVPDAGDLELLKRVAAALKPGGAILLRDYGALDVRMLRDLASAHGQPPPKSVQPGRTPRTPRPDAPRAVRVGEREFVRPGGFFRRYYSLEDVAQLAVSARLTLEEARYCCQRVQNKRRALTMDRVFIHALFRSWRT